MRHLGSLLAGLVIAPLAWVLLAFGQTRVYAYWSPTAVDHNYPWIEPILYLVAAGLLVGLLASTRISPVGPLVAGAAYLAAGVAGLAYADAAKLLPHLLTISGRRADLRLPVGNGTAIVLGAAMLVAVVSASRWRRWPVAPARAEVGGPQPTVEPGTVEPAPETVQTGPGAAAAGAGTFAAVPGTAERRSGEEPDRGVEAPAAREGDTGVIRQELPGAYPPGPSSPPPASWPPVSPGAEMAAGPRHAARDAAAAPVPAGEEPAPADEEPGSGSGPGPAGAVGVARVDAEPADAERAQAERDAIEAAAARAEAERRGVQPGSAASAEVAGNSPWARPPSVNREPPQQPGP